MLEAGCGRVKRVIFYRNESGSCWLIQYACVYMWGEREWGGREGKEREWGGGRKEEERWKKGGRKRVTCTCPPISTSVVRPPLIEVENKESSCLLGIEWVPESRPASPWEPSISEFKGDVPYCTDGASGTCDKALADCAMKTERQEERRKMEG